MMKNPILRYGVYSSIALLIMFSLTFIFSEGEESYGSSEVLGYLAIILSMSFVYLGIRQFRDEVNNGQISFWKAVQVGLMIVAIPSVVFGVFDVIYVLFINPDFMENFYQYSIENLKTTLSAEEFEAKKAELESQKAMFMNPLVQFFVMGMTVFLIGVVASVISSFLLKKEAATV